MKGISCRVIRRTFKWDWAVTSRYGKVRFLEFHTSVIRYVFIHCFGPFLLQAMFLIISLQVFTFKLQNMKLTMKMLFNCIAGTFTMTWVWFLNLETVKDVEGN